MSHRLIEKYRKQIALEEGLKPPPWGGRLSVGLVYPNTYHQGMSNLGMHSVYELLNQSRDTRCERFFLPDRDDLSEHVRTGYPLVSMETQRPIVDFDLIAFSISYENDYINLPILFQLMRIPFWSFDRNDRHPLILCGGVCAFLNPEPLAEIMDMFAIGEAEALLPQLIKILIHTKGEDRHSLLAKVVQCPGIYVPSFYSVKYDSKGWPCYSSSTNAPNKVTRIWMDNLDSRQTTNCISTPNTEFGEMQLVEVSRGCPRACRFCAAGFIYRPFRQHSLSNLKKHVYPKHQHQKVGFVASAVSDHSDLEDLGQFVINQGGKVSLSSVRIDAITPKQLEILENSGLKTLAMAPEAGSQRMRNLINKGINEEQIIQAIKIIASGNIPNLKLYFMVGLPKEVDEDIEAIVALTIKIRTMWEEAGKGRGQLGRLILSVNPFIPKPWTPLQWAPMEKRRNLEKKYRLLHQGIKRLSNVELNCESLRSAELQGFLARGDRRIARTLPLLSSGSTLKAACRQLDINFSSYLHRERSIDEPFPWEIIDQGVTRQYLYSEYRLALAEKLGSVCHPGCHRCGVAC